MTRVFDEDMAICVPVWVLDLESFRRWSDDDAFPETGQISFLSGEVWIDMSKEQLFSHNQVKTEFTLVLGGLVKARRLGRYFSDGAFLSNVEADVSNQPDGTFVSTESLRTGRVQMVEGRTDGHVELEGSPDMVLEVVSRSSVEKDTEILRQGYATAGIREYWLVDARAEPLRFDILRPGRSGYAATRKRGGWVRSEVFEQWFRLSRHLGEDGYPEFTLEVQATNPA
jgi:Uma2 family endonuclease